MNKQNENLFREKFRLLNSQEHSEDIKWSSTSSSEPESSTSLFNKVNEDGRRNRKRKRKKNVLKNLSNLDITIIDSCKNDVSCESEKSPILKSRRMTNIMSPVLTTISFPPKRDSDAISPVLSSKRIHSKSPVLNLKTTSPNFSGRVKKKLCYDKKSYHREDELKKMKVSNEIDTKSDCEIKEDQTELRTNNNVNIITESNSTLTLNESNSSLKSKLMLNIKTFFDSHFSSEHTSQNISTSDTTPSDCSKNEDIEILSCKTQTVTNIQSVKFESVTNSDVSNFDGNIKKVKFKRGGLAFRLSALLKKQNAHISLWQHERFLASHSNFIIPKEEYKVFHIQTCDFQYGCHLLNVINADSKKYVIIINKKYMNTTIVANSVIKLYEPFKILTNNADVKIIVNVCKFECVLIKS